MFSIEKVAFVIDKGFVTADNLDCLDDAGLLFLALCPPSRKDAQALIASIGKQVKDPANWMKEDEIMKVTIFRYDPAVDAAPYYEIHDVTWKEKMTILEVLMYIHENYKPLTREEIQEPIDRENHEFTKAAEWCARCLCCVSSCSVLNLPGGSKDYLGPAGFFALGLRHFDPYDQGDRVLEAVQNGIEQCIHCGKCDEVCPAEEIDHETIFAALISEAKARSMIAEV